MLRRFVLLIVLEGQIRYICTLNPLEYFLLSRTRLDKGKAPKGAFLFRTGLEVLGCILFLRDIFAELFEPGSNFPANLSFPRFVFHVDFEFATWKVSEC